MLTDITQEYKVSASAPLDGTYEYQAESNVLQESPGSSLLQNYMHSPVQPKNKTIDRLSGTPHASKSSLSGYSPGPKLFDPQSPIPQRTPTISTTTMSGMRTGRTVRVNDVMEVDNDDEDNTEDTEFEAGSVFGFIRKSLGL